MTLSINVVGRVLLQRPAVYIAWMSAGVGECVVLHLLGCIYYCIGSLTTTSHPAQAGRVLRAFLACKCRTRGKRAANTAGGVSSVYVFVENSTYRSRYCCCTGGRRFPCCRNERRRHGERRRRAMICRLPAHQIDPRLCLCLLHTARISIYWYSKLLS